MKVSRFEDLDCWQEATSDDMKFKELNEKVERLSGMIANLIKALKQKR